MGTFRICKLGDISSHDKPDSDTQHPLPEDAIPACLEPGDALIFDGAIFHGGGANVTANERRKVSFTSF